MYTLGMERVSLPGRLRAFGSILAGAGYQGWLVGGAVRDLLGSREPGDYDIATDARPEQVARIFPRTYPTGIRHGTVTVQHSGIQAEVTTFRTEASYADGRHPDAVDYVATIDADLSRRDFTINGMAASLADGRLVDPWGGRADFAAKLVRAIGDPLARFGEDGLRPLRACRFAAQLGFVLDAATKAAISPSLATVRLVAAERIRDELTKLLMAEVPSLGLVLMEETGLLQLLIPELQRCAGLKQRDLHCFDVLGHSLATCDASGPALHLRLTALLHDVGKATTVGVGANGQPTFYRHERDSADQAYEILSRLRFPNAERDRVVHLVREHMFNYSSSWSDAAVRRFLARVGQASLPDLLALRRSDQIDRCGKREDAASLLGLEQRVKRMTLAGVALGVADLAVDGAVLMEELQLPPGPFIGTLLRELLDSVVADPTLNNRDQLLLIARDSDRKRRAPSR